MCDIFVIRHFVMTNYQVLHSWLDLPSFCEKDWQPCQVVNNAFFVPCSSLHWLDSHFLYAILVQWSILPTNNIMFFSCSLADSQIKPVLALQRNGMAKNRKKWERKHTNIFQWSKNNFLRAETSQCRLLLFNTFYSMLQIVYLY